MHTLAHTCIRVCICCAGASIAWGCRQKPDHAEPGCQSKGAWILFCVLWENFAGF